MSEEIKIIEDFLNYNKNKEISGVEINAISKLLNCYYNQQKEIQELNLQNIELKQQKIIDNSSIPTQKNFNEYYNYISKDKIREKIKELSKTQAYKVGLEEYTIKILQELLEE